MGVRFSLPGPLMIELQTLGPTAAHRDGDPLPDLLAHPEAFALLVHLCAEGAGLRERLLALWEGDDEARARGLDEAVRTVRREAGAGCLIEEGDHLRCAAGAVACDALRMDDAAAEGDWVAVHALDRGPFLADLPLGEAGWRAWREATASHLARLARHAEGELRASGRPSKADGAAPRRAPSLMDKLKERYVFQVAALYVAASSPAVGAVDMLIERRMLPEWSFKPILVLAVVGLMVAVGTAWTREVVALGDGDGSSGPRWARQVAGRRIALGLAVTAVIFVAGLFIVRGPLTGDPPPGPADLRRLAILYFDDLSDAQDLGPTAAGLTDELIHELAQVPGLSVPSRNAVKPYRDGTMSLDSLLAVLGAGAFVEGSVTGDADSLLVTVQLIDAASRTHLASRTLGAPRGQLLDLRTRLASEMARILRQRLGTEVRLRQREADAQDGEAWLLVQRADQRRDDARVLAATDRAAALRALGDADSLLAVAERRDPRWLTPTVERGWTAVERGRMEASVPGSLEPGAARAALEHAERAVAARPASSEALELRGSVVVALAEITPQPGADSLYATAQRDLEHAVAADSTRARGWVALSRLHKRRAQFAEAGRAAQRALQADYFLADAEEVTWSLYDAAMEMEDVANAQRWCEEGRRRWSDRPRFLLCRLTALASFPRTPEDVARGWAAVDTLVASSPPTQRTVVRRVGTMIVAQIAAQAGLADSARAVIRLARGGDVPDPLLAYNEAHARLVLGERETAIDLLELHVRDYPSRGGRYLAGDWWWKELRGDPRFRALTVE